MRRRESSGLSLIAFWRSVRASSNRPARMCSSAFIAGASPLMEAGTWGCGITRRLNRLVLDDVPFLGNHTANQGATLVIGRLVGEFNGTEVEFKVFCRHFALTSAAAGDGMFRDDAVGEDQLHERGLVAGGAADFDGDFREVVALGTDDHQGIGGLINALLAGEGVKISASARGGAAVTARTRVGLRNAKTIFRKLNPVRVQ